MCSGDGQRPRYEGQHRGAQDGAQQQQPGEEEDEQHIVQKFGREI